MPMGACLVTDAGSTWGSGGRDVGVIGMGVEMALNGRTCSGHLAVFHFRQVSIGVSTHRTQHFVPAALARHHSSYR